MTHPLDVDICIMLIGRNKIKNCLCTTNAIANAGLPRFHRDRFPIHRDKLCWLKQLKSLYTFTDTSGQVPDISGQVVLADR